MSKIEPVQIARMIAQLKMKCIGCGSCCINCTPISLELGDIASLSKRFAISSKEAVERFTKKVGSQFCIKTDLPCMFFDRDTFKCSIYEDRPLICREHPFLTNTQKDNDSLYILKDCVAMHEVWYDVLQNDRTFREIIRLANENSTFITNAYKILKNMLYNKYGIT